ncbi:hypothetical protein G7067_11915 [Leucobacter insecticola]|uniref:Uncharacterized protein n=1 Tax=Leucobacter insecticola TaxID=2714934 RepID=A0A6G8FKT3_9MICO|nr:hypothetical protein [Leucobacter insecticola]QIM16948.1 hypothetical protein G7067_11915 [Leucobacter insecticola]
MAKQDTQDLFEESSQGAVSALTFIGFLLSVVLVIGGMALLSFGFQPVLEAAELWIFAAGTASVILGFIIPFGILPAIGK